MVKHKPLACWPWLLCLSWIVVRPVPVQGGEHADLPVRILEHVPAAVFLSAGDLNGDGKADLALVEFTASPGRPKEERQASLHLFFQKAGGLAMPPDKTIQLPGLPSGLAVGDFDRDGRADIGVGLRSRRSIAIYPASENFAKGHVSQYNNDSGAGCLSAGHINREGLADFLTGAAWRKWMGADRFRDGYFCGPKCNDNWLSALSDLNWDELEDVIFTTFARENPKGSNNLIRIYYGPLLRMGLIGCETAAEFVTLTSPFADSRSPALRQVILTGGQPSRQVSGFRSVMPALDRAARHTGCWPVFWPVR